ncbi:MAG: LysR family transcriptional regulator [Sphingomonas sp.]|uniref:LysR substrate-binding domain-containing protein n=1 Tax=Sphingomonas sp. TaxID=28214 RepID=UPI001AC92A97|nr:LysR substrate-binding domain-containing protein [Sphingomonas sp.]MBN8815245.1 LysR family transcriptional regulator [Sphingomonas sp.]
MLDFGDLTVFAKVVETGSFTRAGEQLGLPKSSVSRRITRLEHHLETQLLRRNTRAVTATEDGALFFEYCLRSIGVLRDGERALQSQQRYPQGIIRIVVPHALSQSLLGPLLAEFLAQYPDVRLLTVVSDEGIAMLRNGFDIAIEVGPLADSGLVATRLGSAECGLFCAHELAERMGMPQNHIELPRFDLLALGGMDRRHRWQLHRDRAEATVEFAARLATNDLSLLRQATLAGLGIASLPGFLCKTDLAEGRLLEVLPGWQSNMLDFYALFADPKSIPVRVRTLIDFLVERLRRRLSWEPH